MSQLLSTLLPTPQLMIDSRSLLEVADSKHRYGKNLRLYYHKYLEIYQQSCDDSICTDCPSSSSLSYKGMDSKKLDNFRPFFSWLDHCASYKQSIHEPQTIKSSEQPTEICFELLNCPLEILNTETVEYLNSDEERSIYKYAFDENHLLVNVSTNQVLTTGQAGDIFVIKDGFLYCNQKRTKTFPRFHHSSFFGGDTVNAAGIIIAENGEIKVIFPHSGHYRPEEKDLLWLLQFLQENQLRLDNIKV